MLKLTQNGYVLEIEFHGRGEQNLLTWEVMRELRDVAREHQADPSVRAVLLTGRDSVFTAGFDLTTGIAPLMNAPSLEHLRELNSLGTEMCRAWERIRGFTIAAIEGHCVGGGAVLALCCDARVASRSARFYVPEILRGMNLQWGAVPRLVNLVGPAKAKRVCIAARTLDAATAERWGIFEDVVPEGDAVKAARALAEDVAQRSPVATQMIKRSIDAYANALADVATAADGDQFLLLTKDKAFAESVEAFFAARRAAPR